MAGCCGGSLGRPLGLSYHTPYGALGDAPPAGVNLPPNMSATPAETPAAAVVPEAPSAPKASSVSPGVFLLLIGGLGAAYMAYKRG